ncbi:oligosaccharyl transferase, archaeosortase A system-associated [uncultured Methanomethylovorans sp.]|uniref:oligosaccharyl transferase, archaeosortase A system-associated n=1 Tax=uncultured Methanomethylovorans sp. TaxID=183759 RepID=UPI002AA628DA|nr:oligosaccharyl transferase, archaeosortase A system-associated [uncultured Methanomethylovorans sp.]
MSKDETAKRDLKGSIPYAIGVLISCLVAFYIRTIPKAKVFVAENFVKFSENDPWYHLRNVESMLHNFPHMLWFDAYTKYPLGTEQVYAPLFDMLLGIIIWILGLGNPSQELIYTVSAYYPVFIASLVVIATYFVTKWIFDRRVGLLAAILIALAPGQILSRSIIGFNDHHIAEVLFSTMTAAFLVMAIKVAREHPITFSSLKEAPIETIKPALPYFILTGVSMGAYTLTWKGALFFSLIIGIYITVQHVVDHMHGRTTDYLAVGGMIIFAVTLMMVLMVPELGGTKRTQEIGLMAGIVAFPLLTLLSTEMQKRKMNAKIYPLTILTGVMAVLLTSKIAFPSVYTMLIGVFGYFKRTGGGLTIGEASPLDLFDGSFYYYFAVMGFVSILGLAILTYEATKKKNTQEKTLLIVWTFMVLWAMLQQNRFSYYYAVNAAILSAYVGIKFMDLAGWKDLKLNNLMTTEKIKSKSAGKTKETAIHKLKPIHIISLIIVIVVLVLPNYSLATQQAQYVGGPGDEWLEALNWMRINTPDPGLDYYELYETPASGEVYPYPDTAYGVMSWWDYGDWIEVIGRRIPNANPFQQGIGGRRDSIEEENQPGASTFFTASSEEEATAVLKAIHPDENKMGARYIVSDVEMATGKFYAMSAWTLDTDNYYIPVQTDQGVMTVPGERYFNSMEAKLHIFDTNGLKHYRMVHESPGVTSSQSQEIGYKNVYNVLFGGKIKEENSGYVKIFEYVEGAKITGTAPAGENVTISTTISTSQGRSFTYSQTTTSDGTYSFIVPYSTEGPISGQTQFDVAPTQPYQISYGNVVKEVKVTENEVLQGNTVPVEA